MESQLQQLSAAVAGSLDTPPTSLSPARSESIPHAVPQSLGSHVTPPPLGSHGAPQSLGLSVTSLARQRPLPQPESSISLMLPQGGASASRLSSALPQAGASASSISSLIQNTTSMEQPYDPGSMRTSPLQLSPQTSPRVSQHVSPREDRMRSIRDFSGNSSTVGGVPGSVGLTLPLGGLSGNSSTVGGVPGSVGPHQPGSARGRRPIIRNRDVQAMSIDQLSEAIQSPMLR